MTFLTANTTQPRPSVTYWTFTSFMTLQDLHDIQNLDDFQVYMAWLTIMAWWCKKRKLDLNTSLFDLNTLLKQKRCFCHFSYYSRFQLWNLSPPGRSHWTLWTNTQYPHRILQLWSWWKGAMLTIIDNSSDECGTSGCNLMGGHHGSK